MKVNELDRGHAIDCGCDECHSRARMYVDATPKYLTLTGDDVLKMAEKIKDLGLAMPHPQLSVIEIAVVEGELAGFGCSQLMFHAEPIEVLPKYRGLGIAEELAKRVMKSVEDSHGKLVMSVASNAHAEKLCEANGMKEIPGKLYAKVLE